MNRTPDANVRVAVPITAISANRAVVPFYDFDHRGASADVYERA